MTTNNDLSSRTLVLASLVLLISAAMQLGTAYIQSKKPPPSGTLNSKISERYTWMDDDFPNSLPIHLENVAMTIENTHHYALTSPDSDAEYLSLYPGELGFLRLGPNRRFFGIAMYHQLHCLDSLRQAIVRGADADHWHGRAGSAGSKGKVDSRRGRREQVPHVDHCLNYLRQTILCSADLTLEPEIKLGSQDVGEGLGVTHVCRDWKALGDFIEVNTEEWHKYENSSRSSHARSN